MLRWMLLGLFGLMPKAAAEPRIALVPQPARVVPGDGALVLKPNARIAVQTDAPEGRWAAELLDEVLASGLDGRIRQGAFADTDDAEIVIRLGWDESAGPEGYHLSVAADGVVLEAPQPLGLLRGVQTLRQLLPAGFEGRTRKVQQVTLPHVRIEDQPRYRWRGMLLDCCRHFMEVEFVKRYIDLLAYHRMNRLHWHLTEDQGWRIEIKRYPKLTEVAAWRGPEKYGGYYSQEQIREVLDHARKRGITVVPEIELPGHSTAALAAYPELGCTGGPYEVAQTWGVFPEVYCAGNEQTFTFLENVLAEVIELFPSEYIHIGGDECPKIRWEACAKCQARIKAEGLADEHELQSYFVRRIEKFLSSRGRRLIGWDEILEGGLAPNATVQSWRGMQGAIEAARAGHDVISSPTSHCYLDYAQVRAADEPTFMGFVDLETAYSFEPTPDELSAEEARHVLGLEGNMWTEHAPQPRVDYQVFPRLCALAEVGWSPRAQRDWPGFSARLETHLARLDALGVNYFQPAPTCTTDARVFTDTLTVELAGGPADGRIVYTLDGSDPTAESTTCAGPLELSKTTTLKTRGVRAGGSLTGIGTYHFVRERPHAGQPAAGAPGLTYAVWKGAYRQVPTLYDGPLLASGTATACDLSGIEEAQNFAALFRGRVRIETPGRYTFYLTSDDGSRLSVAGRVVVDNDGLHGSRTRTGQILLEAGDHDLGVDYFQAGGGRGLRLEWSGPGIERAVVPAEALWHVGGSDQAGE